MTRRCFDPHMPGVVQVDDRLVVEPTLTLHADEVALLRPALDGWIEDLRAAGASAKVRRLELIAAKWRYVADWYADASADDTATATAGPSQHEWLTTSDVADALGVTPARVRQLLEARELDGHKGGRVWSISAASVLDHRRAA